MAKTTLSDRELQIVDLMARGLSEKEIAEKLFVSPGTINNHTRHIREKLGVSKNTEVILYYIAKQNKRTFSLREIRQYGINIILVMINVCLLSK